MVRTVLRLEIRGRVQGVGYRWAMVEQVVVPLEPDRWTAWFEATPDEAMGLLVAPPAERCDMSDALRTDQFLGRQTGR